jgi:outer membrane protein assembly factor BamA
MAHRALLPFGLVTFLPCHAKTAPPSKECSTPPASEEDTPHRNVVIESVVFDGPIHLSDSDISQIVDKTNELKLDADNPEWISEFTETGLRSAWQNRGYFKVEVAAKMRSLWEDPNTEHFQVDAHVVEGSQFHLGELSFTNAEDGVVPALPDGELRSAFPLHEGDLFNVGSVREGIETLKELYGSRGYIDFTAMPQVEVDDNLQRISLEMRLDEQKQFHVDKVEIRDLDPRLEAELKSIIMPGEIFNPQALRMFIGRNKSLLPPLDPERVKVTRNPHTGIVNVTFDPGACPSTAAN